LTEGRRNERIRGKSMEPKHFNMLAVAAVISLIAAGVVHSATNDWSAEKVSGQKLFPELGDSAGRVASVLVQKGKDKLTFEKHGKGWAIKERSGYPVKVSKVRQLLVGLETAELVEPKTREPDRYKLLELGDPKKEGANSTLVALGDGKGKTIAEVVIGKRKVAAFGMGQAGTYVRRPGIAQSWLANANVRAPTDVSDWVDPVFFRIDPKTIKSLSITAPKAQPYELVADDKKKGQFKFAAVPDDHKLKSGVSASNMAKAIKTLELLDVHKIKELPSGDGVFAAMLETTDGMKVDFRVRTEKTDRWISLDVVDDGKNKKLADKLRAATKGWEFKVADWRARQTFKEPKELFEPVKAPAPKTQPPKVTPGATPSAKPAPAPTAPGTPGQGPDPASGPGGAAPKQ
jgi:Domain of unknown function (DUF4340)